MRIERRPRHYLPPYLMLLLRPLLRYSHTRDAYVLRAVGSRRGPVLRADRRRSPRHFEGAERRHPHIA
jgi:hypothetical protein